MTDNRVTALTLERSCTEHHFDGYSAACSSCRRATREAKYELLGCKRSPQPTFKAWYEKKPGSLSECDYRCSWGPEYKSGDAKNHHRAHWLRKLEQWAAAAESWECFTDRCMENRLRALSA